MRFEELSVVAPPVSKWTQAGSDSGNVLADARIIDVEPGLKMEGMNVGNER